MKTFTLSLDHAPAYPRPGVSGAYKSVRSLSAVIDCHKGLRRVARKSSHTDKSLSVDRDMEAHARFLAQQEAVHKEAQRIASLSAMKLFRSRSQRGGMRLHRSLQLAMVMKSARELIISSAQPVPQTKPVPAAAVPMEVTRESRKRRSCGSRIPEPVLPSKRACLWQETPHPQPQGGAFPGLAEVLQQLLLRTVPPPPLPGGCRSVGAENITGVHARPLEAF